MHVKQTERKQACNCHFLCFHILPPFLSCFILKGSSALPAVVFFSPSFLIVSPVLFIVFFVTLVFPLPFEAALGVFLDY